MLRVAELAPVLKRLGFCEEDDSLETAAELRPICKAGEAAIETGRRRE